MFRRGIPFRPAARIFGFLGPMFQGILNEANQEFESGDYREAARRYTRLAERAAIRGKHRAGNWLVKAGQANVLSGAREQGMQQIFRGMEIMQTQGRQKDVGRYAWRTIDLFTSHGLTTEARQVSDWLQGKMPDIKIEEIFPENDSKTVNNRQKLPSRCPSCGAPVHPDTVDWVDNGQAACGYCGILLPEG